MLGRPGRGRPVRRACSAAADVSPSIGIPLEDARVPMQAVVLDELDIVGVRAAAGEMPEAVALVSAGKLHPGELITHRFALRDFADAYATFTERREGALKVIVYPWEEPT